MSHADNADNAAQDMANHSDIPAPDVAFEPDVNLRLEVGTAELVSIGVVQLRNALDANLKATLKKVHALDGELTRLRADLHEAAHALDVPEFDAAVAGRVAAIRDLFGLPGDGMPGEGDPIKVRSEVESYGRATGRQFSATVRYERDGSREGDSASFTLRRTYPTPQAVIALEDAVAAREAEKAAAERHAKDVRAQMHDRQGLADQVTAKMGIALLGRAGDKGVALRDALLAPSYEGAASPVLALLDGRSEG